MKKLPGFKIYFERTDKVLPLHQYYDQNFLDNETIAIGIFF